MKAIDHIFSKTELSKDDLVYLLETRDPDERAAIYSLARATMLQHCGNDVGLRGLIELSNVCGKNCLYCGIRAGNREVERYTLDDTHVVAAARHALEQGFGSVVIQSGERHDRAFTAHITDLVGQVKKLGQGALGITLSCGEQTEAVYREWLDAGAHRYLLRIEASDRKLYEKLHPADSNHSYDRRVEALMTLQRLGYQTGTGVMIGLPWQTTADLAGDLIFMKGLDIDMVGMGPYIPHHATPLTQLSAAIPSPDERLELSLRMIALLRIMMKDINIAASTALHTLDPLGRVKAVAAGANVFMPNITPLGEACKYGLYEGKPLFDDMAVSALADFEKNINKLGLNVAYHEWSDSRHYGERMHTAKITES
jgi:biotin synthase